MLVIKKDANNTIIEISIPKIDKAEVLKFTLIFEDGKIIKYLDKSGREEDSSKIEEFNTYLVNDNNNTDAMSTIKALLASFGGNCN